MSILSLLPVMITAAGLYFLFKLRFFFVLHPVKTTRCFLRSVKGAEARRALMLALAGTLGVGNIVGVAFGISVGGAGSLFWMIASGIFAAVIKYAESSLAASTRSSKHGGMMHALCASFSKAGRILGGVYSALGLLLAMFMGAALQTKSAAFAGSAALGIPIPVTSFLFTVIVTLVILKGTRKVATVTSFLIPVTTIIYIIMAMSVIFLNFSRLPSVIKLIISSAFKPSSAMGGIMGFLFSDGMRTGFLRGMLSNEAGAGTSSMAQATSLKNHPAETGLLGVCEVVFDTVILCSLTGLAVLLSVPDASGFDSGVELVSLAFSLALGSIAPFLIFAVLFCFAFSTVICWFFYGSECLYFLFGKEKSSIFTATFVIFCFFGFLLSDGILIAVTDYLLFFMTVLTLSVLIKNSERIKSLSENRGLLK